MAIIYNTNLQPLDFQVYGVIYWYCHMSMEKCIASNEKIATILSYGDKNINPTSVANSVSRLAKEGCVKVLLKKNNKRIEIIPLVNDDFLPNDVSEVASSNDEGKMNNKTHPSSFDEGDMSEAFDASLNDDRKSKAEVPASSNDEAQHHQMMKRPSSNDEEKKNIEQKEINKKNNISSNEEIQQAVEDNNVNGGVEVLEGEVARLPKSKLKTPSKKQEPNPDGSYGNPEVNEVRTHFLEKQGIPSEDCTRDESGRYWSLLLKYMQEIAPDTDRVAALKKFIDCLASGKFIDHYRITSGKKLYYSRNELYKKIREHKTRYSKQEPSRATYDNIIGGVAY